MAYKGLSVNGQCYTRESLLRSNAELIELLQTRLKGGRFKPQEGDTIKLGYIRALIQALQAQNTLLKDTEFEEIKDRLKKLESIKYEVPITP